MRTGTRLFIDAQGAVVEARRFAGGWRALSEREVADYAVNALGLIWLEMVRPGLRLYLNPSRIQSATEAALFFFLWEENPERILVRVALKPERHRIYASASAAIAGIAAMTAAHRRKQCRRFASRCLDPTGLARRSALGRLLEAYRATGGFGDDACRKLLGCEVKDRYLMVERPDDCGPLVIRAIGAGYEAFDADWSRTSSGLRIDEQPDVDYGAWLANSYRQVLETMTARAEEVDAIIYRPRYGLRRFGYCRAMLPFTRGGRRFLLSASVADPSIDLGVDQVLEAS